MVMNDVITIKKILSSHKEEMMKQFRVSEIGVFGSYVRKEEGVKSDIDILVDFEETPSLFEFLELRDYLSKLLGNTVDLVMKKALRPNIGRHILKEVILV